ncbi:MAG: NifB/NifX family molybdenum-iron cluster-binding protein [Pseudomonadota bacterium]
MALQRQLTLLRPESEKGAEPDSGELRVAFASSDLKRVDQHFGSAERFAIYAVRAKEIALVEVFEFGSHSQDGNEKKLLEKFVALDGVLAVYCLAVGPSAVRQLISLGIQPIKVNYGSPINALLRALQNDFNDGARGWLSRALALGEEKSETRFDEMEEEGWSD